MGALLSLFQMFRNTLLAIVSERLLVNYFGCKTVLKTMPYYAVARGRMPGIFKSWSECEGQVKGFSGARYKKFNTETDARDFVRNNFGCDTETGVGGNNKFQINSTINYTASCPPVRNYGTTTVMHGKRKPENTRKHDNARTNKKNNKKDGSFNIDGVKDPQEIEHAISKHLDSLESRLEGVKKNLDKISNGVGSSCSRGKRTLLIEHPQSTKRRREDGSFDSDEQGIIQVYTDGACSSNGQKGARAGYGVWWGDGHPLNTSAPVPGRATNNCGEIQAAVAACRQAKEHGIQHLCINTDSKFLIDSVTKWMAGWKQRGYRTAAGAPVKNTEDFLQLEQASSGLNVQWRYVEAHRGVRGNEEADRLAREGAARYLC